MIDHGKDLYRQYSNNITSFMIKVGIFGLGTVGQGFLKILRTNQYPIEIVGVVDRSYQKKSEILAGIPASDDPEFLLKNDDVDVIIELIGGVDTSLFIVREALDKGKNVITANKHLLAEHGYALFIKAKENKVKIGFEAAVAGALPIIRNLENIFLCEKIELLEGILNGTTNYILTKMRLEKKDYGEVLTEAQKLGLAEADPTLDVNGMDAVHKLSILGSLLSRKWIEYHNVYVKGIEDLRIADIEAAGKMGYRIRQLSRYHENNGDLQLTVEPTLIGPNHFLYNVELENNAIMFTGEFSGEHMLVGKGAGSLPTAFSVLSDAMHIVQGNYDPFQRDDFNWKYGHVQSVDNLSNAFYFRVVVMDKPGVMEIIGRILSENEISIASVHQDAPPDESKGRNVDLIIVTHVCQRKPFLSAIEKINSLPDIQGDAVFLPIDQ